MNRSRAGVAYALALTIAGWPSPAGVWAQERADRLSAGDRPTRAERPDAPAAETSDEAGAAAQAIANQRGVVRHRAQGYRNLWYPNLESPPEDSLTADAADTDERLGTRTRSLVDERPLWRMLSEEEYANARDWLEKFREWHPDWEPSAELLRVLEEGELLAEIARAQATGDWSAIVGLADRHPDQFTCETVFNLWALAEARAALNGAQAASAVYQDIVRDCARPVDRLVTLQRAAATIGHAPTWPLVQREAGRALEADAAAAFDRFRGEFHAAWLSRVVARDDPAAGEVPARQLAGIARQSENAEWARLLGWYAMERRAYSGARRWFVRSLEWERGADGAYGLALAWLRDGARGDAYRVASAWRGSDPRFDALLAEIAGMRARRAFDAGDYEAALRQAEADLKRYGGGSATAASGELRRIRAWSLFNLDRTAEALDAFTALYAQSPGDPDLAAAVIYAGVASQRFEAVRAAARQHGGRLDALARAARTHGDLDADGRELRHLFHTAWFGAAASNKAPSQAVARARPVHDLIVARRDAATAIPLGWAYMDLDRPEDAQPWFRRALDWTAASDGAAERETAADAAVGLVAALRAQDRDGAAETLARRWADRVPVLAEAARDLTLARADEAYTAENYADALRLTGEARDLAGPSRRGRLLAAWSHYQLGEADRAADLFEALYREQPDAASGEGLFFAGRAAGRDARLAELARRTDGPLTARWRDHLSQRYLDLDLYAQAARTAQGSDPRVAGADAGHLTVHGYARSRDGDTAEGQLDVEGLQITGSIWHGRHRFGAGLAIERLDSGRPDGQTQLGTPSNLPALLNTPTATDVQPAFASGNAVTLETVYLPTVSYGYSWPDLRGATLFDVTLGTTPLSSAVDHTVIWKARLERREAGRRGVVEIFDEPRTDSLFAYAGIKDPQGLASGGRVVERGVRVSGAYQITGPWSLDGQVQLSELDGKHVMENDRVAIGAGLNYELGLSGFDYVTVGPRYAFESYDENLSAFTAGHGGYFSPESLHRISLGAAFQTDDGADFVLRGSGSVGWQVTQEGDTVLFPRVQRHPRNTPIDGERNEGLAVDARLDGVYRLTDRVALGFRADTIHSQDFQEFGLGLFLRLSLDARGGALAGDIPELPLR